MKTVFILALSLLFVGCVSHAPMDITRSGRDSVLPPDLKLTSVRLTAKLAAATDTFAIMGSTFDVQTGKVYMQVFTGGEEAGATLDLVNSSMTQSMNDVMIIATKSNITYSATVVLKYPGGKQVITSSATASTAWSSDRAAREAVERVVIDIAKQVEVHLKN